MSLNVNLVIVSVSTFSFWSLKALGYCVVVANTNISIMIAHLHLLPAINAAFIYVMDLIALGYATVAITGRTTSKRQYL